VLEKKGESIKYIKIRTSAGGPRIWANVGCDIKKKNESGLIVARIGTGGTMDRSSGYQKHHRRAESRKSKAPGKGGAKNQSKKGMVT